MIGRSGKRITAVTVLLLLTCLAVGLPLNQLFRELFHFRQMLLVAGGTALLYLAGNRWKKGKKIEWSQVGRDAVMASGIVTYVQLFLLLTEPVGSGDIWKQIALSCRPVLYGLCIYTVCYNGSAAGGKQKDQEHMATDSFYRFQELGLTRREAEIAVFVCKGFGNAQIAEELHISETTVKKHLSNIFEKKHIKKREALCGLLEEKEPE